MQGSVKESINTKEENFRSNVRSGLSYSIGQHQYKTLRKQGRQSVTINSGYYPETYNEAFEQLTVSEKVWVEYKGDILPVNIKSSFFKYKDT